MNRHANAQPSGQALRERWAALTRCVCDGARLMVGQGNYDTYVAHIRKTHPDQQPMTPTEFFRERQNARFGVGGRGGFRCC
jgi:uncharacterized short protein YbdD (DUF466 family)